MKKHILGFGVGLAAVGAFALGLTDVPNEGGYPAAKSIINANNGLIEVAVSNLESGVIAETNAITLTANLASVSNQVIANAANIGSVSNTMVAIVTNVTSVSFVNLAGTTNTLLFTNGTIRIQ